MGTGSMVGGSWFLPSDFITSLFFYLVRLGPNDQLVLNTTLSKEKEPCDVFRNTER